jgi:hypothetical protein
MREIQLMNAGTGAVISSPSSSEAAAAAAAAAATLAGAGAVGKVVSPRCPQPAPGMILHPALRELGRAQGLIPAATSEYSIDFCFMFFRFSENKLCVTRLRMRDSLKNIISAGRYGSFNPFLSNWIKGL